MSRAATRKTEATAEEEGKNQVCISTHAVATPSPKKKSIYGGRGTLGAFSCPAIHVVSR